MQIGGSIEQELAPLYKKTFLGILESRRFDKVKLVRETMNHTLGLWKQLEGESTEVSESSSSSKSVPSGLSATQGKRSNTLKAKDENSNESSSSKVNDVEDKDSKEVEQEGVESKENRNHSTLGTKRVLFSEKPKPAKIKENGSHKSQAPQSSDEERSGASSSSQTKNGEELSLIRNQITRIEKQQSSLLDLFQICLLDLITNIQQSVRSKKALSSSFKQN